MRVSAEGTVRGERTSESRGDARVASFTGPGLRTCMKSRITLV